MNNKTTDCSTETKAKCRYFNACVQSDVLQSRGDGLDLIALLLSYLVLWSKPETTLFPTGLMLYALPCAFNLVKFGIYSDGSKILKWLYAIVVCGMGIIAFFGVQGDLQCIISNGENVVTLGESLTSVIHIPPFKTLYLLSGAGIPVVFSIIKYTIGRKSSNPMKSDAVASA